MTDYIFEGISHEVFFAISFTMLCVFLVTLLATGWLSRLQPGSQVIHPSQREDVDSVRSQITQRNTANSPQDNCPICIEPIHLVTETNCGHLFCAPCIVAYWNHGNWYRGMNCPVCRQEVTVLLVSLTEAESATELASECLPQIKAYNRRFSGEPRTVMEYLMDFPVLLRHMFRQLFTVDGMVWMFRLRVILYLTLVALYVVSPFDLIPESAAGVLGFMDDIILLIVVLIYLTVLYRSYVSQQ